MNKYDDIINLSHHTSLVHPRMSMSNRAAQFAPFAALTGHKEAILEEERITDVKIDLGDNIKEQLDEKIEYLFTLKNPSVSIEYFVPDTKKSGGKYIIKKGIIRKIDRCNRVIIFYDKTKLNIDDIYYITIENE